MGSPRNAADDALGREFDLVVGAHERRLGQFLVQMVGSVSLAEDLLQETFLVAFREREQLRRVENVTAWLYAIARNRALHALRTRRRSEARLRRLAALFRERDADPANGVAVRELLERHLEPDERALLILRYVHGFDSNELAQIADLSPEAVRQRLSRIRRRLLDVLGDDVAARTVPPSLGPVELAHPELVKDPLDDEVTSADAVVGRRLVRLLAPLGAVAAPARREPAPALAWKRLRARGRRTAD